MKKLLAIVVLGMLLSSSANAEDPNTCFEEKSNEAFKAAIDKNYSQALKLAEEAVKIKETACAYMVLSELYYNGWGIKKDLQKAFYYNKLAAEKDSDQAQKLLAISYLKGEGVEKNPREAFKWFEILAQKNNANGQTYLAYLYSSGTGIEKNLTLSYMWFYIVSKQFSEPANSEMIKLKKYMSEVDIKKAVKMGDAWLSKKK